MTKCLSMVEFLEENNFTVKEYEPRELCIETWTDGGVNMVYEINYGEILDYFSKIYTYFDIDEQIDLHRQDKSYCEAFTYKEAVADFEKYEKVLKKLEEKALELINKGEK